MSDSSVDRVVVELDFGFDETIDPKISYWWERATDSEYWPNS
jgi:hypothetical protein